MLKNPTRAIQTVMRSMIPSPANDKERSTAEHSTSAQIPPNAMRNELQGSNGTGRLNASRRAGALAGHRYA
jgi:hypothetical protein